MDQFNGDINELIHWQTNRRQVIKAAIVAGTLSQLSFLQACTTNQLLEEGNDLLDAKQVTILKSVLEILFPNDGNGPGIEDIHALAYVMWVLHDAGANEKYRNLLVEGIDWADAQSLALYQKNYIDLDQPAREKAIATFAADAYGSEWLSIALTYILEALLLDPIYGGNPDGIGWKWLNHTPGYPQATEELRYEKIMETVRASYPKSYLMKYDVCIIGSGAGAGPVIYELANAGFKVLVLEKGPWFKTEHFTKDDMVATRRAIYTPAFKDEFHVLENKDAEGNWKSVPTFESRTDFWNGSAVGGSSNFMSAYFHRLKPNDFRLLSEYGDIEEGNMVDWPITYNDLEPFYTKVESVVGVSGVVVPHKHLEPRSTPDYPYPPLVTNQISDWFTAAGAQKGYNIIPAARGIISQPKGERRACYLSNYCGSFGCSSDGKSSSRAALINDALKTGNVEILPDSKVFHLETNDQNEIIKAWYYDLAGLKNFVEANLFVVAAQAVETARLLLMSKNPTSPNGLANNSGNVGKNLLFSAFATGSGYLHFDDFPAEKIAEINNPMTFVNRTLIDFYEIDDQTSGKKIKGGIVDFLYEHSNPMPKAVKQKKDGERLVYGSELKTNLHTYFTTQKKIRFEAFTDWIPNDNCFVTLDETYKDKWGDPVAKVRLGYHEKNKIPGEFLAEISKEVLTEMGLRSISSAVSSGPTVNLQAGGCRFGNDPKTSVLDKNCKAHEVPNLYVTDGSFMPTGGSVPFTFTIYANAFRVAEKIIAHLQKNGSSKTS